MHKTRSNFPFLSPHESRWSVDGDGGGVGDSEFLGIQNPGKQEREERVDWGRKFISPAGETDEAFCV